MIYREKHLAYLFAFFAVLSLFIQPWRDSFAQDDGAYAALAIAISRGQWIQHPLLLAAAWPQTILGALISYIFPSSGLKLFNLTTWFCFGLVALVIFRNWKIPIIPTLSILAFPIMVQYGASYLSEMYAILLLVGCLSVNQKLNPPISALPSKSLYLALLILVCALALQRQTLVAFPFCWGICGFALYRKPKLQNSAVCFLIATFFALIAYSLFPKSILQTSAMSWHIYQNLQLPALSLVSTLTMTMVELVLATGLFLIPLVRWSLVNRRVALSTAGLQVVFILLALKSGIAPLSAGVLFTGYLPLWIAFTSLSFGFWGLLLIPQCESSIPNGERYLLYGSCVALVPITLFYAVLLAGDIKYSLPLAVPFIFLGRHLWRESPVTSEGILIKNARAAYLAGTIILSIFVNLYNLDTVEARWQVAKKLEAAGTQKNQISAGYGRDLYELGWGCADRALSKINQMSDTKLRFESYSKRVFSKIPRLYEDEWASEFVVKPSELMGHKISLNQNFRPGQNTEAVETISYGSWGMESKLEVFKTENVHLAWCDQ